MDSSNMATVKRIWGVLERDGVDASTEAMLSCCHEDVELSPYSADGRVLHGAGEVRDFLRQRKADGSRFHASAWTFAEQGDDVIVSGSIRVHRADGSLADAQVRWIYGFSDGLVKRASFAPLAAA
jgi:hypothetical protein